MASDLLKKRFLEIERLAKAAGLNPYDVHYFEVPASVIYQVASYGLPTRYSHWSFGRSYQHQKAHGEMGYSKIYELIINNDPSYAFLDRNNTDVSNMLVAAHCLAHSSFFKNNIMFQNCGETNMVEVAKRHAEIIDEYRKEYGDEEVDDWLDIVLSLQTHIDVYRGYRRDRYQSRRIVYKEKTHDQWHDLVNKEAVVAVDKQIEGEHIPPHPEKDLLWFFGEYANLEMWQKRVFEIVRRESYYFYPQYRTKVMNEGFASYWHAELMHQYALGNDNDFGVKDLEHPLTSGEHLEFVSYHEKVVQPGVKAHLKVLVNRPGVNKKVLIWNPAINDPGVFNLITRLNPYYLGFRIYRDIKERWDKYYEQGYYETENGDKTPVTINGTQKIFEVMGMEDDVSFFRKYLTEQLVEDLHLFYFSNISGYKDDYKTQKNTHNDDQEIINNTVIVKSKEVKGIVNALAKRMNNYGSPMIIVRRIDENGRLRLEHLQEDDTNIDVNYGSEVLKYIYKIWLRPVELIRKMKDKTYVMSYGGSGKVDIDYQTPDYPECIEQNAPPSSW
jgi:stage V sporulation protein R